MVKKYEQCRGYRNSPKYPNEQEQSKKEKEKEQELDKYIDIKQGYFSKQQIQRPSLGSFFLVVTADILYP